MKSPSNILFFFLLIPALSNYTVAQNNAFESDIDTVQDSTSILFSVTGLSDPEAVRYDETQDVYFISNWDGSGGNQDANGFISKVDSEGNMIKKWSGGNRLQDVLNQIR
jgi:hypothetical protein